MKTQASNFATLSLKSLGASKALLREVHELKSLDLSAEKLLSESIKFISQSSNQFVQKFVIDIDIMMKYLTEKLPQNVHYILWTKYFNLAIKLKTELIKTDREKDEDLFEEIHAKMIQGYSLTQDWRIAKKLRQVGELFNLKRNSDDSQIILNGFRENILSSLEYIIWHDEVPYFLSKTKEILTKLYAYIQDSKDKEEIVDCIVNGRFEKGLFTTKTLIIGEDGGLYMLLNSLEGSDLEALKKTAGEDYIKDKIKENNKIIIGTGAFGTVRFALSLFTTKKTLPGQVICIKKTKTISYLEDALSDPEREITKENQAIHYVIDSTVGDYFSSNEEIIDLIYSPQVLDLSIKISNNIPKAHRKGYLMMEIVPQNTGTSVLIKNKTPVDWISDQKPYIRQVFEQILALLNKNIAMTDLKPDNTLYDIDNKRAFIIDLGGSLKIEEGVEKCNMKKHDFQFTPYYTAPEVTSDAKIIDLRKALAYSCGKILEQIVKANNHNEKLLKISEQMMNPDPISRMSIENGLQEILKIGDDKQKNAYLFEQYIRKIKLRLETNRSSISINEDIHEIREILIPTQVIKSDPDVVKDDIPINLQEKIDKFLQGKVPESNLFLLLGNAGSGKSILLQIEYIKAVYAWDQSKPLPIYFNLANGVNLKNVIQALDYELGINLYDFIFDKNAEKQLTLFIDSFDEGIYQNETERENLLKQYSETLCSNNIKYFISCRTDFLNKFENYDKWFIIDGTLCSQIRNKFYIVPLTYKASVEDAKTKENSLVKSLVKSYIENVSKMRNKDLNWEKYYGFIQNANLESEITTGFIFHMIMKCYLFYDQNDKIENDGKASNIIQSKVDVYKKFVAMTIQNNLREKFPLTQDQKTCILKENCSHEFNKKMETFLFEVGKYIAKSLHVKGEFRLKKDDKLFEFLDCIEKDNTIDFRNQRIYYILRNLPLKIEIKKEKNGEQELAIGFIHDTIKNYFLLEGIKQEAKVPQQDYSSKILGARNIVEDYELVTFLRDGILEHTETRESLTNYLLHQIYITKEKKDEEYLNSSSNSMTILIATQYCFYQKDLANTVIRNSNLRNGIFASSDLRNIDLRESNMTYVKLKDVDLSSSNLSNIKLGMGPNMTGHTLSVEKVIFSPDGKFLATFSFDKTARIWEVSTEKQLQILQGHDKSINNISFSPDGKYLATCSEDKTVKIWEVSSGKLYKSFIEYRKRVKNITFSPDGMYLATCSKDKTARILEVSSGKQIHILKGHISEVLKVRFSSDGKYLATCSKDTTARIWEVSSGNELITLEGHPEPIRDIRFSPDGKYLVTCCIRQVRIWDASSYELLRKLKGNQLGSYQIRFSPNGKYLATYFDKLIIWEIPSGKQLQTLSGHTNSVNYFRFSPDGKYLATCSRDKTARLWEVSSGKQLQNYQGHTESVNFISFSPNGKYLATCSSDRKAKIWEVSSSKQLQAFQGHSDNVNNISFSPDGKYLATCSDDKTVRISEASSGKQIKTLEGHEGCIKIVVFSPDGAYLATCSSYLFNDGIVNILEVSSGKKLTSFQQSHHFFNNISFSPDGKCLATCSDDKTARIWEISSGKELKEFSYVEDGPIGMFDFGKPSQKVDGHIESVNNICFSPDGKYLATCSKDNTAKIWCISSGRLLKTLQGHNRSVNNISYSPDGKYLATCSDDTTVRIWEASSAKQVRNLQGHTSFVDNIRFTLDGKCIATCSKDKTARIWEVSSGKQLQILEGHNSCLKNISFSPDGKYLATCSEDTTARIWEVSTGKQIQILQMHDSPVNNIIFSPDGKYLATCSKDKAVICEIIISKELQILQDYTLFIKSISFSPDQKYIATCSQDRIVRIWEISSGKQLQALKGHTSDVLNAYFSPDGKYLATFFEDKTVRIWEVSSGKQIQSLQGDESLITSSNEEITLSWLASCNETSQSKSDQINSIVSSFDEIDLQNLKLISRIIIKPLHIFTGIESGFAAKHSNFKNCKISIKNKTILEDNGIEVINPQEEDPLLPQPSKVIPHLVRDSYDEMKSLNLLPERSAVDIMMKINETSKSALRKLPDLASALSLVEKEETRQHITSIYDRYYLAVGLITVEWETEQGREKGYGTGTMIAPNLVLTAAHNVVRSKLPAIFPKLLRTTFVPGITALNKGQIMRINIIHIVVNPGYEYHNIEYDIAILVLEESIGNVTGFLSYKALDDKTIGALNVTITGYPDKFKEKEKLKQKIMPGKKSNPNDEPDKKEHDFNDEEDDYKFIPFMMRHSGLISKVEKEKLQYEIHTSVGQSGASIVSKSKGGQYFIIGVHSAKLRKINNASRITPDKAEWIDKVKKEFTTSANYKRDDEIEETLSKIKSSTNHRDSALAIGMKYLNTKGFENIKQFHISSEKILAELEPMFASSCKVFNRYLTIADKMMKTFYEDYDVVCNTFSEEEEDYEKFKIYIADLAIKYRDNWRAVRKILLHQNLFTSINQILGFENETEICQLLRKKILAEIENARESIIWQEKKRDYSIQLGLKLLDKLKSLLEIDSKTSDQLIECIIKGKIDKEAFGLPCSLLIGDDGGLYALLNSMDDPKIPEEIRINSKFIENLLSENDIDSQYLEGKLAKKEEATSSKQSILIGKGSFGKVRFALSLFDNENLLAGELICVKKYEIFGSNKHMQSRMIELVIDENFSHSNEASKIIYSPAIYDISTHLEKGYLFMALIPRNTGGFIFNKINNEKFDHLKTTYLLEVVRKILRLIGNNIIFTDLKPENTLFDTDNCDATLIDLGGTIEVADPTKFDFSSYYQNYTSIQFTEEFSSPELLSQIYDPKKVTIDLKKSLSYSFGKLIKAIIKEKPINLSEKNLAAHESLNELSSFLTLQDPQDRITLDEALSRLKILNETASEDKYILSDYVQKISRKIKTNPLSLDINPEIDNIKDWFIPQNVTHLDPEIYPNLDTKNLDEKFASFKKSDSLVFLLLGNAGSGKSSYLQLNFIEFVQKWKFGDAIPIYFNLASNVNIKTVIENIDLTLNTNLKYLLLDKSPEEKPDVILFIDSFDEATFDKITSPSNLITQIIQCMKGANIKKLILTCRSDYKPLDDDWFRFKSYSNGFTGLEKLYIAPLDYNSESDITQHIYKYCEMCKIPLSFDECYAKIRRLSLSQYLNTGLMFSMIMKILTSLEDEGTLKWIPLSEIYELYMKKFEEDQIEKSLTEYQKLDLNKKVLADDPKFLTNVCLNLAYNLHKESKTVIMDSIANLNALLTKATMNSRKIITLLKVLPLKVKKETDLFQRTHQSFTDGNQITENLSLGFNHDTLKNFFILQNLNQEVLSKQNQISDPRNMKSMLGYKMIVDDLELMRLISNQIQSKTQLGIELQKYLLTKIYDSRILGEVSKQKDHEEEEEEEEKESIVNSSANSISILVASKYDFSCSDLQNVNLKNANIKGGRFLNCNFNKANLKNANMSNCELSGCSFVESNLENVNLSILPDLIGHSMGVTHTTYSPDGKYLASSSWDKTCKIWDASTGTILYTLQGHSREVTHITYSPDGKYLVSCSLDHTCKIWDASTGEILKTLQGHLNTVTRVAFSPDGRYLASSSNDNTCKIWDASTGQIINTLQGHSREVSHIAYSPDGKYLATSSHDNTCKIWDAETGKVLNTLQGHSDRVTHITYSPDCKYLASSSWDKTCKIWDASTGTILYTLQDHSREVTHITYSPNGKYLASSSLDNICKIWDASTGQMLYNLQGHSDKVNYITYSPDGKYLASCSHDYTCKIWDASTGNILNTLKGHSRQVIHITYSPDGKYLASSSWDSTCKIWEASTGKTLNINQGHSQEVTQITYSPDGKYLASVSLDNTCKVWDASSGKILNTIHNLCDRYTNLTFSSDGKKLACSAKDNTCKIWDVSTGKILNTLLGHCDRITRITYSHDSKYLASSSHDKTCKIWDALTGEVLKTLEGHSDRVTNITYSLGGKYLASSSEDYTCKIWDASTGEILNTLQGHSDIVIHVIYSPDGRHLASSSKDNTCIIWDAVTGKILNTLQDHSDRVTHMAYSPDSNYLATSSHDNTCKTWEVSTGRLLNTFKGHSLEVTHVIYSPDGRYLASSSVDKTCKIWDALTGKLLNKFQAHSAVVTHIAYSPDGKYLASSSKDNTCKIWDASTGKIINPPQGHFREVTHVAYSPDGQYLASSSYDNTCKIWDALTGKILNTLQGHSDRVTHVTYSPDGKYVVSSSKDNTCKIWDALTGEVLNTLQVHSSEVTHATYSPDGKYLATTSWDETCKIWDASTGTLLNTLQGHSQEVNQVTYSPDGKYLATSSWDETCKIWDASTGKLLKTLQGHSRTVSHIVYSPDGKNLATSSHDNTCKIWDASTGEILNTLRGHSDRVTHITYSPDGKYLASGSYDKTCKIWKASTGEVLKTLQGHSDRVTAVTYSPDGKYLVSSSFDKTCKIWDASLYIPYFVLGNQECPVEFSLLHTISHHSINYGHNNLTNSEPLLREIISLYSNSSVNSQIGSSLLIDISSEFQALKCDNAIIWTSGISDVNLRVFKRKDAIILPKSIEQLRITQED